MSNPVFTERIPLKGSAVVKLCAHLETKIGMASVGMDELTPSDKFTIEMLAAMDVSRASAPVKKLVGWIKEQLKEEL